MERVLQVSVKERAVALTWRVTLSPKKLNSEMLMQMAKDEYKTVGVLIIWFQPRGRSKNVERADTEGMARIGMKRRTDSVPKKPSQPTATRAETEYRSMAYQME